MSERPLVSVCIPTYRGAEYLAQAIDSVLAQTLTDFELVIVDDQSPDDTEAIVARYTDPRIRYLRNPVNLGPEGNWNRCLSEARGTYVKVLPHDDLLVPECLERQTAAFAADPHERLALVFSARTVIDADGRPRMRRGYPRACSGVIRAGTLIRQCLRRGTNLIGEPGAVLMRRSFAERTGAFNSAWPYVIDLEYWFRLLLLGDAWYDVAPLAAFRISAQQWSVVLGRRQSADFSSFVTHASKRPEYGIGRLDVMASQVMARANNILRLLYFRLVLER